MGIFSKQNLYEKLDDVTWNKLRTYSLFFFRSKESLLQNILKKESKEMYKNFVVLYHGNELHFNLSKYYRNIKCYIKDMKSDLAGYYVYKDNSIRLNSNCFCNGDKNSGYNAYYTMIHEFRHVLQYTLVMHKDKLNINNDIALRYINQIEAYMDWNCRKINCLSFQGKANLHITPYYTDNIQEEQIDKTINELSLMFYRINISEYDAFMCEINASSEIIDNLLFEAINIFRMRYNCSVLSEDDIIWNVNECILKVYNDESPDSDLQANIMYDLCCIALLEHGSITESECTELLKDDIKGEKLQDEGFAIFAKDIHAIHIGDTVIVENIEEATFFQYAIDGRFDALSDKQLMNNPKLVLYIAAFLSNREIDCTYLQTDILKKYCHLYKDELFCNNTYYHGSVAIFGEKEWDLNSQHDL